MKLDKIFALCIGLLILPNNLYSAWQFNPNITTSGTYTDNVELEASGEDSEFVIEVTPGFELLKEGGRFQAGVNYFLQNLFYTDDSDRDETYNQLDAYAALEVLRDRFFINADSTITQQIVDPDQASPASNVVDSRNSTDRRTFSVNPVWQEDIGSFADLFLSYRKAYVDYDDSRVEGFTEDNELDQYEARLGNLADVRRWGWELFYVNEQEETEDTNLKDEFERYGLQLEYLLTTRFALIGVVGDENNDFEREAINEEPDGSYWEAGFRWTANPRNNFEFRYGDRDFGNTRFLSWNRAGTKLETTVSFTEDLGTDSAILFDRDPALNPVENFEQGNLGLSDEVFERERFEFESILNTGKGRFTLNIFDEDRKFLSTNEDEESKGGSLVWAWQFASRTSLNTSLRYTQIDSREREEEFDRYRFQTGFVRTLGANSNAFLDFGHNRRDSDESTREYEENFATIGVYFGF